MDSSSEPGNGRGRRNKSFAATHDALIKAAVHLISEKGVEALSLAELARAVGITRTTIYYHFANRQELLDAVAAWSSEQLTLGLTGGGSQQERSAFVTRFVLDHPDLIRMWIEQFVGGSDIRDSYPSWDELLAGLRASLAEAPDGEPVDVEVFAVLLLSGSIVAPLVFRNGVRPDLDAATIADRIQRELQRVLWRAPPPPET